MRTAAWRLAGLAAALGLAAMAAGGEVAPKLPEGYKLLYSQDFKDAAAIKDFVFPDPAQWQMSQVDGRAALDFAGITPQSNRPLKGKYEPKYRSPLLIALVADRKFGDFTMEAEVKPNTKPYGHQDICLFFGFTGPTKFYYAHVSLKADAVAHKIHIVNDAPRAAISKTSGPGVEWGDGWHKVRVERRLADGSAKVFFDDGAEPVMTAEDKTFGWGYVGVGSFDDSGFVRAIRIWGTEMKEEKTPFLSRK